MPVEALRKQWDARAASAPLHRSMTFDGDDLVLGAGTKLAAVERGTRRFRENAATHDEARLLALLSAAYRREIGKSTLAYIRHAIANRATGETAVALTHLAMTGLPRLAQPEQDARRLFMADGLMKAGVRPQIILRALNLGEGPLDELERRYNPDQPRVPAGNGRESGQWTGGNWETDEPDAHSSESPAPTPESLPNASRPIQIADASSNWFQYLNPISEAEAAGNGPNIQHQEGVDRAIEIYRSHGFGILTTGPVAAYVPGFPTPRFFDFCAYDPVTSETFGVEVKTTMNDTVFFNRKQVDKDVAIYTTGGAYAPALRDNAKITRVAYEAFCTRCSYLNIGSWYLWARLFAAGIPVRSHPYPGGDRL